MSSPYKHRLWRNLTTGRPSSPNRISDDEGPCDNDELLEKSSPPLTLPFHQQRQHLKSPRFSNTCIVLFAIFLSALISTTTTVLTLNRSFPPAASSSSHISAQTNPPNLTAPFHPTPRLRHCGTTASEARQLGCQFQIWSYSWVPSECYDGTLVAEWLALRDWEYYDDKGTRGKLVNFTTEVLVAEGDRKLYSTWGQHYWHCAFTWRKFLRAALGSGVGITDQDLDAHHAEHCQDTIRNKFDYRPWGEVDVELVMGYHRC